MGRIRIPRTGRHFHRSRRHGQRITINQSSG
ncbi:hypothetical protein E2C01_075677 [Portunus trituberculatus]|uniref:Uncharacterized protein n=1 Tax=Portunus trituberculatus TaxID=210409 RepID=A0A5B7IHP5_PORTR|nr:hypothetical protein [Portunus trituberculatus]